MEENRPSRTTLRLAGFPHFSYLPQFVAQALGAFADEGLEITLAPHQGSWSSLIESVGLDSDIIVGNIWFALQQSRRPNELLPVAHCLRQSRFLLYRRPAPGEPFKWRQLAGASVIIPTDVPTPWIAFRQALAASGLSLDQVRVVVGYSNREAAEDVSRGVADFAVLDIDLGERSGLEEVAALADRLGPVPWSVYLASATDIEARPAVYRGFQRAIERSLSWIHQHDSPSLAELVAPWFPSVDRPAATQIIERYRRLEAWPGDASLAPEDVERWQAVMVRWGLMPSPVPWRPLLSFINHGKSGDRP